MGGEAVETPRGDRNGSQRRNGWIALPQPSQMDFTRMRSIFEKHEVSFVAVTQQFNTRHGWEG